MSHECCRTCAAPAFTKLKEWPLDHVHTVHIDSRQRTESPGISTDFVIPTPSNIVAQKIGAAKIVNLQMMNKFFSAQEGQIIDFIESAGTGVVEQAFLPAGQYTNSTILAAIKAALELGNNSAITYTSSRDSIAETLTFSPSSGEVTFLFASGPNASTQLGNGGIDPNYIYALMGFTKADISSSGGTITSNSTYNVYYQRYFYIAIDAMVAHPRPDLGNANGSPMESELYKTTFRVPINNKFNNELMRDPYAANLIWVNPGNTNETSSQEWRIRIYDQTLREAKLYNMEWAMTLQLYMLPDHWSPMPWNNMVAGGTDMQT